MTFYLQRLVAAISQRGWRLSVYALSSLFVSGWLGMLVFEPDADISKLSTYWWWFLVTVTTVGYGDVYPTSPGGRVVGACVFVGGIAAMGIVLTQISATIHHIRQSMMSGLGRLKEEGHTVILGYHPLRTEELVREMEADALHEHGSLVLCFDPEQAQENPLPGHVQAVRGRLGSRDVVERACVATARAVILDGRNDNETLAMAVAVRSVGTRAHVVAALDDMGGTREQVEMVCPEIECVPRGLIPLLVQASVDPGISQLYSRLMTNLHGHEGYAMPIPEERGPWRWIDLLVHFKTRHDATLLGYSLARTGPDALRENPAADELVRGGATLFYIAPSRITRVEWPVASGAAAPAAAEARA